jgi:hypothetical protein
MARGGFMFLLFKCLVPMTVIFNNLAISMNLFRFQQLDNYHLPAGVPPARRQGAAARCLRPALFAGLSASPLGANKKYRS